MLGNGQYFILHGGDQYLVLVFADTIFCFDEGKVELVVSYQHFPLDAPLEYDDAPTLCPTGELDFTFSTPETMSGINPLSPVNQPVDGFFNV